ncbi:hypothetical protein CC1G_15536 [Coprinopsis cinerea okayama7|uniref:NYN domain-containing protein n=1 Tax=Coprinopsis cinerea (strain Okayama-7 / 130 / ATCC MYA-4618 / FGSC 9003) TaxID=240176 RepID=D6RN24_COPC7|nr:hypothetical protein CC1G_15536 [Coprinopsis cinerea okayama7\|eukprot:XP_002910995.1 hypothetical protein CC1G_15536 [Coprinopsis cinerea okayama7\
MPVGKRHDLSADLLLAVQDIAMQYGPVTSVQAYLSAHTAPEQTRMLLLESGVTVRDCAHGKGQKDFADKQILTDILLYALDGSRNNYGSITFVLVTGDRDFSYTLSKLCLRKYGIVLVSSKPEVLNLHSIPIYSWVDVVAKAETSSRWRKAQVAIQPIAEHSSAKPQWNAQVLPRSTIQQPWRSLVAPDPNEEASYEEDPEDCGDLSYEEQRWRSYRKPLGNGVQWPAGRRGPIPQRVKPRAYFWAAEVLPG